MSMLLLEIRSKIRDHTRIDSEVDSFNTFPRGSKYIIPVQVLVEKKVIVDAVGDFILEFCLNPIYKSNENIEFPLGLHRIHRISYLHEG